MRCHNGQQRRHVWSITNIPLKLFVYYPLKNLLRFCDSTLKFFLFKRQCRSPVTKYCFSAILRTYSSDEPSLTSKPVYPQNKAAGSPGTKISISDIYPHAIVVCESSLLIIYKEYIDSTIVKVRQISISPLSRQLFPPQENSSVLIKRISLRER